MFLDHYHLNEKSYAKLTRLKTRAFNPKIDGGVEQLVAARLCKIIYLDSTSSEAQICNALVLLFSVSFQRQLVLVKNVTFSRMLESIRRLELIYDTCEFRKAMLKNTTLEQLGDERLGNRKAKVQVREEATMMEPKRERRKL